MLLSLTDNADLYILGIEGGKVLRDHLKRGGNNIFKIYNVDIRYIILNLVLSIIETKLFNQSIIHIFAKVKH